MIPSSQVRKEIYLSTYKSQNHDDTREAYRKWAPFYEYHIEDEGWKAPQLCADLLSKYEPSHTAKILDVGAGTGLVGDALHQLQYNNLHAADLSPDMLQIAERKKIYFSITVTSAEAMPFDDEVYDVVICVGALNYGHIPPSALKEICRVTRKGGLICFTTREDFYENASKTVQHELTVNAVWVLCEERYISNAVKDMPHRHWCYKKI